MSFQGQGHRLGGPPPAAPAPVAAATAAQPAYATTPADLSNIPVADVVAGPPAGSSGQPQQASVPNAQMAYTVRTQPQAPQEQVIIVDPALARYLASHEQGVIPPQPPDYLPLTVLSCCCCWPVALMAIYHSRLVRFFYSRGQFLQAYESSRKAKQLGILAIVLGSTTMIVYYFMMQRRRNGG